MKKQKLCFALVAFLATTLATAMSGFAANDGSTQGNGSAIAAGNFQETMMTVCQGGILPATMVSSSTDLQIQPATGNYAGATVNINVQTSSKNSYAQDASYVDPLGSGAQLVTAQPAETASSGGSTFHAGKYFVASTPIAGGLMMTSIAT